MATRRTTRRTSGGSGGGTKSPRGTPNLNLNAQVGPKNAPRGGRPSPNKKWQQPAKIKPSSRTTRRR